MLVWGGLDGSSVNPGPGGVYNPGNDQWVPMTIDGEPLARGQHTAVWVGNRMIVWGGYQEAGPPTDTGGKYE
jgi:hypothetical protein